MESFLGKSESIEKMIDPVDEIIIAQKKQSLYCRKDTFTKIAFCCLLTLIFPAADLFVSGVIQLPEFLLLLVRFRGW